MDEALKQYTALMVGNLGLFECKHALWAVQYSSNLPTLMQKWLSKLNLTYCLIYLDDMIAFSKTEEKYLWCLCIVFKCFREHNLMIKPSKCKFFQIENNYLAHHVSKVGIQPSKENLNAVAEFALPQTYTKIWAFLALVEHYWWFMKGFTCLRQLLHEHLSWEGASKKNEWVMLTRHMQVTFEPLKKPCLEAPVPALLTSISHYSRQLTWAG